MKKLLFIFLVSFFYIMSLTNPSDIRNVEFTPGSRIIDNSAKIAYEELPPGPIDRINGC